MTAMNPFVGGIDFNVDIYSFLGLNTAHGKLQVSPYLIQKIMMISLTTANDVTSEFQQT